jgi:polysaccharide export outer membrane protein
MILRTHLVRALSASCAVLLLAAPLTARAADPAPPARVPGAVPAPAPAAVPPAGTPSGPTGASVSSTIHPGDTLAINVYGEQPTTVVVQADGTIQHPLAGRVLVGGLTVPEAHDSLVAALRKYIKRPVVTLAIQQQGQITVTVLGNVKNPGKYQMRSGSRLSDAVAAGGGLATIGLKDPLARVQQSNGAMQTANVQKLQRDGDPTQNLDLDDGAYVYISGAETIRVQVIGAVSRPGNVEVGEGDRLSMALARAGAEASARSDLSRVYLTRTDPATGKTTPSYEINVYNALQRGDQRYDPILQANDKIWIPEARSLSAGAIGIFSILGRLLGL